MKYHDDCPEPPEESVDDLMVRARKYIGFRVWDQKLSENEIKTITEARFLVNDLIRALEKARRCRWCHGDGTRATHSSQHACYACKGTGKDR